jgi:site-specific DNA-methyltransferase (adenine-specific)
MKYKDILNGRFYNEDTFEAMADIPNGVIDMLLVDLPYGTTACSWDSVLPFDKLWCEYNRVCKSNAAMVFTASQPFTTMLIASNIKNFKVEWIWQKNAGSNFATVKYQPMKEHENIVVFSNKGGKTIYNPIKQARAERGKERVKTKVKSNSTGNGKGDVYNISGITEKIQDELRYPSSIQKFNRQRGLHPTQKPVELFEYLIRTYSNEGDIILDNTAGSGTTAIAAINANRKWVCIEKDEEYYAKAIERITNHEREQAP